MVASRHLPNVLAESDGQFAHAARSAVNEPLSECFNAQPRCTYGISAWELKYTLSDLSALLVTFNLYPSGSYQHCENI